MRRLLVLIALAVLVVVGRAAPGGALSPIEPADPVDPTTTRPVVITEPEGTYDDATTTTWAPIGGPDGDVIEPSLGDRLLPEAAVAGGVVLVAGVAVAIALQARRRRPSAL